MWWLLVGCDDGTGALRESLTKQGYEVLEVTKTEAGALEWFGRQEGKYCKGTEASSKTSIGCFSSTSSTRSSACFGADDPMALLWRCDSGREAVACTALGLRESKKDPTTGFHRLEEGCALGDSRGCFERGYAAAKQGRCEPGVADWYRKGGELGDANSWTNLGVIQEFCEKDLVAARASQRRGCELGGAVACKNAAVLMAEGRGGEVDVVQSKALMERGCTLSPPSAYACLKAGVDKHSEDRWVDAMALWARGCEGGEPVACRNMGVLLASGGHGVEKDTARSIELRQKACDGGDEPACKTSGVKRKPKP